MSSGLSDVKMRVESFARVTRTFEPPRAADSNAASSRPLCSTVRTRMISAPSSNRPQTTPRIAPMVEPWPPTKPSR